MRKYPITTKLSLALSAIALTGLGFFPANAHAASRPERVVPHTGSACGGVGGSIEDCLTVVGSGLYVDYITSYAQNNTGNSYSDLHIRLYGPDGTIQTSPTFTLKAYSTYNNATQYFDEDVPAGGYCIQLYDGSTAFGTHGCATVHS